MTVDAGREISAADVGVGDFGDVEDLSACKTFLVGEGGGVRGSSDVALLMTNSSGASSSASGRGVRLRGRDKGGLCAGVKWCR